MTLLKFMAHGATGNCAVFTEPVTDGDIHDPDSDRNAPLNGLPEDWLDFIQFHSSNYYMQVDQEDFVTINHSSVSGASAPEDLTAGSTWGWATSADTHTLVNFSPALDYIPLVLLVANDQILYPGMPVQTTGHGGGRFIYPYADQNGVYIKELVSADASGLDAASIDYTVWTMADFPEAVNHTLFDYGTESQVLEMGFGKFDSRNRYLQVVSEGSPFGLALGKTIDIDNGAPRFILPDGTNFDPVPDDFKYKMTQSSGSLGSAATYNGSFVGEAIEVQAP